MRTRWFLVLMALALVSLASACGDDGGSPFEETTGPTEGTVGAFEGTPGTIPQSAGTIVVEAAGEAWELPAAVCLRADGDAAIVLAAAQQQAAEVRSLVGHLVSGWPTTTWAQSFDYEAYERDLNRAAITALALADLLEEQAALEEAWLDYEAGYASPDEGWGAPDEISGRLDAWKTEAGALPQAMADYCAG